MTNVGMPILIYGAYAATNREYRNLQKLTPELASKYPASPVSDRTPVYRDIVFSNITATVRSGSRAGLIWGLPEKPASNIVMQKVEIRAEHPFGIFDAKNVQLENCLIITPQGTNQLAITNAQVTCKPLKVELSS